MPRTKVTHTEKEPKINNPWQLIDDVIRLLFHHPKIFATILIVAFLTIAFLSLGIRLDERGLRFFKPATVFSTKDINKINKVIENKIKEDKPR